MEKVLDKRELVAMLMESPFYFELLLRERLALVRQHQRRFSISNQTDQSSLAKANTIVVGFFPRKNSILRIIPANL